jgi:hypothetical protein
VRFALSEAMVAVQLRHKRWREKAVDGFLERKASSWSPSFVLLIPIRLRDHLHSLVLRVCCTVSFQGGRFATLCLDRNSLRRRRGLCILLRSTTVSLYNFRSSFRKNKLVIQNPPPLS